MHYAVVEVMPDGCFRLADPHRYSDFMAAWEQAGYCRRQWPARIFVATSEYVTPDDRQLHAPAG